MRSDVDSDVCHLLETCDEQFVFLYAAYDVVTWHVKHINTETRTSTAVDETRCVRIISSVFILHFHSSVVVCGYTLYYNTLAQNGCSYAIQMDGSSYFWKIILFNQFN